jgi:uncharacterized protein YoxC
MAKSPGFKKFKKSVAHDLDAIRTDMEAMRQELEITRRQLVESTTANRELNESVQRSITMIEQRVDHMGTELTNQLHELGGEIDKLSEQSDASVAETVAQIHSAQIRLTAEQARYEIAFRQDLAELAEYLRRGR